MSWKFCITDAQRRALDLCGGSMDEGDGWGSGDFGNLEGDCWSPSDSWGCGVVAFGVAGDGKGSGYGGTWGDGGCPPSWK